MVVVGQQVYLQSEIDLRRADVKTYEVLSIAEDGTVELKHLASGDTKIERADNVLAYAPPPTALPMRGASLFASLQSLQRSGLPFPTFCPVVPDDGSQPPFNFIPRDEFLKQLQQQQQKQQQQQEEEDGD